METAVAVEVSAVEVRDRLLGFVCAPSITTVPTWRSRCGFASRRAVAFSYVIGQTS